MTTTKNSEKVSSPDSQNQRRPSGSNNPNDAKNNHSNNNNNNNNDDIVVKKSKEKNKEMSSLQPPVGFLEIAAASLKRIKRKSVSPNHSPRRSKSCDATKTSSSFRRSNKRQQKQRTGSHPVVGSARAASSDSASNGSSVGESPSEETVTRNIRHYVNLTKHMDPNAMLSHMSFQDSSFIRECLHWHNYFRTRHQVPELTLSPQLCASAQEWANLLANTNTFRYRNQRDVGENLFCRPLLQSLGEITGKEVAIFWYSNIRKYDFTKKPDLLHIRAGSFSQMVWSGSKYFGIAKARTKQSQKIFIVAHYYPPGNVSGRFHEHVFPPVSHHHQHHHRHNSSQRQSSSSRKKSKDDSSCAERRSNTAEEPTKPRNNSSQLSFSIWPHGHNASITSQQTQQQQQQQQRKRGASLSSQESSHSS